MNLTGRRILVTGASSGIGQATAVLLSQLGASVIYTGRDQERLEQTSSLLEGDRHAISLFDLRDLDGIPKWLANVTSEYGSLHGIVHAAGIQHTLPVRLLTPSKWRESFLVNTEAALSLVKGFLAHDVYAGAHGSIVFISSIMGLVAMPGTAAYSLSKGALNGLARALALELAPKRIRVNCVAPAFVHTKMFSQMERVWNEKQRAWVNSLHPLGIGEPQDVAYATAFLLADTGRWITGIVLPVDGGYTAQ